MFICSSSCHAVIFNQQQQVLLVRATYGSCGWGLPGGALEPGKTIHQALDRECKEELGIQVQINYLSGVYFHSAFNSQAFIFCCGRRHGLYGWPVMAPRRLSCALSLCRVLF
ncbi:MAG: NUDIX domain-containing protein [Pseudomonadales bacterium]|nr:NUDIX domain-containing protein [Pseudomonadales bacterium]